MKTKNTILHVEDDANDVILIGRAFRKANISSAVEVAYDGEQAVAYLSGQPPFADRTRYPVPSLVLLDLKLPRKSGLDVLAWIRGNPELKRLPVVILSSSKQSIDINRAYDLGANGYLAKPVNFDEMTEVGRTLDQFWGQMVEKPTLEHKV